VSLGYENVLLLPILGGRFRALAASQVFHSRTHAYQIDNHSRASRNDREIQMTIATLTDCSAALLARSGIYAICGLVVLGWEDANAYVDSLRRKPECRSSVHAGPVVASIRAPFRFWEKCSFHSRTRNRPRFRVVCYCDHGLSVQNVLKRSTRFYVCDV